MDKDIQMFEISDKNDPIGTEIFDNNLPSNIDFDQQNLTSQRQSINPQKKIIHNTIALNPDELQNYNIKGKAIKIKEPLYFKGAMVNIKYKTYMSKVYDEQGSKGFKKFWQSIVGYSKRQLLLNQGYLYIMQKTKDGLFLHTIINIGDIFKVFIDPEQNKIRIAIRTQTSFVNKDFSIDDVQPFLKEFASQFVKIGLTITNAVNKNMQ